MIACLANVEYGIKIGCLPAGSQHSSYTSFECSNLGSYGIVGRVLQAGVEITTILKIKQTGHLLTGFIFESSTLIDGQHTRLPFFRSPSCLYTQGFGFELFCHNCYWVFRFIALKKLYRCKSRENNWFKRLSLRSYSIDS